MNKAVHRFFWVAKRELLVVCGVIAAYSFLIFLWANFRGAIGVARNDDWVYLHMARWFADFGQFKVESGSMANAFGLVILGQPTIKLFGYSIVNMQILEIVVGAVGLLATWLLLRSFLSIWISAIGVLTLVASPFWISTSVSFMTDVPAYSFQIVSLLFAVIAFRDKYRGIYWLAIGYFFSLAAFSVREYSIASGLAITAFYLLSRSQKVKQIRWKAVTLAVIWFFACLALYYWRSNLENAANFHGVLEFGALKESSIQALRAICMLGFLLVPALLLASPAKNLKQLTFGQKCFALIPSLIFTSVIVVLFRQRGLLFGNYFTPQGSYVETFPLGIAPNILPAPLFDFITWAGVAALAYLMWLISIWYLIKYREKSSLSRQTQFENVNEQVGLIGWYVSALLGTLIFVPLITNAPLFDRYFIPVIPCLVSLVLYFIQQNQFTWDFGNKLSTLALVCLGLVSAIYVDSSFILDGLKWKAGSDLVQEGYSAETLDAGYEWFGYHQQVVADGRHIQPIRNWWITLYDSPQICASVGVGILDSQINPNEIIHKYEVQNLVGTNFVVWSVDEHLNCTKNSSP